MTARGVAIQGGLALAGLFAAYTTWQREPELVQGEVVLVDVTKKELERVRFQDETRWVEITRRPDSKGDPAAWILSSGIPAKTERDRAIPEREVRGNETALRLLDRFAPLRVMRALGTLEAAKLKELGLEGTKKVIEVIAAGDKRRFTVGSPAGSADAYLQDERDGRVYLLARVILSDLEGAAVRLVDRSLHGFKLEDADALTLTVGGKKRDLLQRKEGQLRRMTSRKTPDKVDEQATNWHDKVSRLFPAEVLGKGETPAGGEPTVLLRIDYRERDAPSGFLELARGAAPPAPAPVASVQPPAAAPPPPPAPVPDSFARTEHTAGWVKLPPTAGDVVTEAEKVVAAE